MDRNYRFKDIIVSDDKYLFIPREEIIGRTIWDLPSGELVEQFIAVFEKTLITGKKESFNHRSPLPDDDRWFKAFDISMSFGYETKSHEKETIQEIFKNAEDNMYRNKLYESLSIRNKTKA